MLCITLPSFTTTVSCTNLNCWFLFCPLGFDCALNDFAQEQIKCWPFRMTGICTNFSQNGWILFYPLSFDCVHYLTLPKVNQISAIRTTSHFWTTGFCESQTVKFEQLEFVQITVFQWLEFDFLSSTISWGYSMPCDAYLFTTTGNCTDFSRNDSKLHGHMPFQTTSAPQLSW